MDLIRVIYRLRPDVTWLNDTVNAYSKYTLQKTYQSSQPFPSDAEGIAAWAEIQAEDAAEAIITDEMADLAKANTYLTDKLTPMSLSNPDKIILRDTLLRMFKYLKYGK